MAKLKAADNYTDPLLAFVTNYTYSLGQDDLVELGATQYVPCVPPLHSGSITVPLTRSSEAGQETFTRYSSLLSAENIPFVRASSSDRVVATANNWTAGEYLDPLCESIQLTRCHV